jgi:hypothetical protein
MLVRYGGFAATPSAGNVKDQDVKDREFKDQAELAKMREIDPQSETRLTEALRRLAAASPQAAPPEVGAGLLGEFRRHHTRRRRIRRLGIASVVACLVLAVALVTTHTPAKNSQSAGLPATSAGATEKQETQAATSTAAVAAAPPRATVNTPKQVSDKHKSSRASASAANRTFLALPGYDPTVPLDELHVVRVQLPASALWQIGAPMTASAGTHNVTADFVVSQGGTPYAVRLVQ